MKKELILNKVMEERNGSDELNIFIMYLGFTLLLLNIVFNKDILLNLALLTFITNTYRCYSKNKYKRQQENKYYLNKIKKIKAVFIKNK